MPKNHEASKFKGIIYIVLIALIACQMLIGCEEKTEVLMKYKFKINHMVNFFEISSKYYVEQHENGNLTLFFEYPSMNPIYPGGDNWDKTVRVLIQLRKSAGDDEVQAFLKHVEAEKYDPAYPHRVYKDGVVDGFQIYRDNKSGLGSTYFLSNSLDGQPVLIEDIGPSGETYRAKRNVNEFLSIDYQIPKKIGRDFIKVDSHIISFLKSHLRYQQFHQQDLLP